MICFLCHSLEIRFLFFNYHYLASLTWKGRGKKQLVLINRLFVHLSVWWDVLELSVFTRVPVCFFTAVPPSATGNGGHAQLSPCFQLPRSSPFSQHSSLPCALSCLSRLTPHIARSYRREVLVRRGETAKLNCPPTGSIIFPDLTCLGSYAFIPHPRFLHLRKCARVCAGDTPRANSWITEARQDFWPAPGTDGWWTWSGN